MYLWADQGGSRYAGYLKKLKWGDIFWARLTQNVKIKLLIKFKKYSFKNIEIFFGRKFCHDQYEYGTDFVDTIYKSIIFFALY